MALNPNNHDVYVVDSSSLGITQTTNSSVVWISSSNVVSSPIKAGHGVFIATYDPTNHDMYVAEQYSNVTLVLTSANSALTLTTKGSPVAAFYDLATKDMLLLLNTLPTVDGKATILSSPTSGTPKIVGTQSVQKDPYALAYDPTDSDIYVSNSDSNTVTVF